MKLAALVLVLMLGLPGTVISRPPACFPIRPSRAPLPVDVKAAEVRTEGPLVWILLAYHNPTATPLHLGLQQWANACTQLVGDAHTTYTLLQTVGIGYGYDLRNWLTLPPDGQARVVFLFRANDPTDPAPRRYTLTSAQLVQHDEATAATPFTVVLHDLFPH
jgi:hypothetical protein